MQRVLERVQRAIEQPEVLVDYLRLPRPLVRGGPIANRLGLQAVRAIKERAAWNVRDVDLTEDVVGHLETLNRDGYLVLPDFFSQEEFALLDQELEVLENLPASRFTALPFGENYESRVFFVSKFPKEFPEFTRLLRNHPVPAQLACHVSRREPSYKPHVIAQWVYKKDPQKPHRDLEYNSYLHVDRHYPFLKAFLYLRDVPEDCAPYSYVPGSHRFNWNRLKFEYRLGVRQSIARKHTTAATHYSAGQKASDQAMNELANELCANLKLEPVKIAARKNTLILSNNQGLHRRAEMNSGSARVSANMDYKFLESVAHRLYPLLHRWQS